MKKLERTQMKVNIPLNQEDINLDLAVYLFYFSSAGSAIVSLGLLYVCHINP